MMRTVEIPIRSAVAPALAFLVAACGGSSGAPSSGAASGAGGMGLGTGSSSGSGGMGTGGMGGMAVVDAGCPADAGWSMPATGPDSDGDGYSDCDEAACGTDPHDAMSKCYACGWKHSDPGNLKSTGAKQGDVIANLDLVDQCNEPMKLWDMAGEYHILFMTAAW